MKRFTALLVGAAACAAPVIAAPVFAAAATVDDSLKLAFADDAAWAQPLADGELHEIRGAAGLMFSVFFSGALEFNQTGGTTTVPEGLTVTSPSDNLVQISGGVGSFAGSNGVFQFTEVNGSLNVVNNNMIVQVAIVNDPGVNLATLFPAVPIQ